MVAAPRNPCGCTTQPMCAFSPAYPTLRPTDLPKCPPPSLPDPPPPPQVVKATFYMQGPPGSSWMRRSLQNLIDASPVGTTCLFEGKVTKTYSLPEGEAGRGGRGVEGVGWGGGCGGAVHESPLWIHTATL